MIPKTYTIYKNGKTKIYKASRVIHSHNPVYKIEIHIQCPFPHEAGRKKSYQTLFVWYMHLKIHHPRESFREMTMDIADLIIKGVLT